MPVAASRVRAYNPGVKLVLEGGGCRAAFSAGVLLALERANVRCDAVIGSSTSAVNAAYFAARQMDTCVRVWTEFVPDGFVSYRRLLTPWGRPAIDVDRMVDHVFREGWSKLDVARVLDEAPVFYAAATEVPSGEPVVVRPTESDLFEWLRASTALPVGYNRVVQVAERRFVDGGLSAPVPFDVPLQTSTNEPTVVILTRKTNKAKTRPGWWQRALLHLVVPPEIRQPSLGQHELYNAVVAKLTQEHAAGRLILVTPPPAMTLSRLTRDPAQLQRGVDIGVEVGEALLPRIAAWQPPQGESQEPVSP
ncbi:MAG: patatin family protein [Sandaracinaceae bacterium]